MAKLECFKKKAEVKFTNEFGEKELVKANEFIKIENMDLRLRNTANVALNHFEDDGEEVALEYILTNVPIEYENEFRTVFEEIARKRGVWSTFN